MSMSAVTYHGGYAPTAETAAKPAKKGLFARIMDALIEARMREAARQIAMYRGYLPEDLRARYDRAVKEQPELPFGR
jgi:hypothetical protein